MEAKYIKAENFMSWQSLEVDDFSSGLTLIDGENGVGKSSIWDAPSWCLFGETVRGVKNDAVVNRKFGKDCSVRFVFNCRGDEYDVRRYRSHSGRDSDGNLYRNRLFILYKRKGAEKAKLIEKGTLADTQRWLLDNIEIDFKLYSCTVVYAQGDKFNFVNETDKSQKEILSKVRRIDFKESLTKARELISNSNSKISGIKSKIEVLKSHSGDKKINDIVEQDSCYEEKREQKISEIKEKIKSLLLDIKQLEKQKKDVSGYESKSLKLSGMQIEVDSVRSDLRQISNQISSYKNKILKADGKKDSYCDDCGQYVDYEHIGKLIESHKEKIVELKKEKRRLSIKRDDLHVKIGELEESFGILEDARTNNDRIDIEIKYKNRAIAEAKSQYDSAKKEVNPFKAMIKKERDVQAKIKLKLAEFNEKIEKLNEITPYLVFWENAFSDKGIKSFLFDSMCSELTNRANHYINILTGGEITISFDTQTKLKSGAIREKFECVININGAKVPYEAYSGGEKTRISLAVDLALSDIMSDFYGSSLNFMVMDEQDVFLDNKGRDRYLDLLKDLSANKKVFVVSHDDTLKAMFDDVMSVEKVGSVSRFVS